MRDGTKQREVFGADYRGRHEGGISEGLLSLRSRWDCSQSKRIFRRNGTATLRQARREVQCRGVLVMVL